VAWLVSPLAPGQDASYDPHKLMLARSHYEKGMKLVARDQTAQGEAELLQAVEIFPQLVEGHIELGNLSMQRGEFTQGLERYLKARDALSSLQGIKRLQESERQRRIQESIDLLTAQIDELHRSQRAQDEGKIQQVTVRLEKLQQEKSNTQPSEETPYPPELHFLMGTALMKLERFQDAARELQEALALRPGFGEAHNNLAVVLYFQKDYPACWEHIHAAEQAGVRVSAELKDELSALFADPAGKPVN
jgi:tetratricopeptide (TPR) repeat protein